MNIFFAFLLRLGGGMALAMALTSARHVSSGFFRNHLYVLLGVLTLGCLAANRDQVLFWQTVPLAGLAYGGAVSWLYDAKRAGKVFLWLLALGCLSVAYQASMAGSAQSLVSFAAAIRLVDAVTASWLLGMVLVSMLLGHWYLNAPEMEISPLSRLLAFTYAGLAARVLTGGVLLVWGARATSSLDLPQTVKWLLVLRWLCGFAALGAFLWMAWQTLKIPNTQSATGLLYVAVFAVLAGEIVSLLLSARYAFVL